MLNNEPLIMAILFYGIIISIITIKKPSMFYNLDGTLIKMSGCNDIANLHVFIVTSSITIYYFCAKKAISV